MNKTIWIVVAVLAAAGVGAFLFMRAQQDTGEVRPPTQQPSAQQPPRENPPAPTSTEDKTKTVIGTSAGGRNITAYHYGTGEKEILFVGGIHGGYEWNTALVAYQMMDYLQKNPGVLPAAAKVTVIPVLNPDGLSKVVNPDGPFKAADVTASQAVQISGRYNGNTVDLNRNFDCDWQAEAVWKDTPVSGGTAAFSEPESRALKNYVDAHKPTAVVAWYSAAGGVFSSNCHAGVSTETKALTKAYADASGYPAYSSYDFYEITGDMMNWFAKNNIPAISVLLSDHIDTEWSKNQAGINALLLRYAK